MKVEAVVDSGACDTVTDPTTFPGIPIVESEDQKAGINYHGPSGKPIPNCGEQQVEAFANEGILCATKWQIAEGIRRPLLQEFAKETAM